MGAESAEEETVSKKSLFREEAVSRIVKFVAIIVATIFVLGLAAIAANAAPPQPINPQQVMPCINPDVLRYAKELAHTWAREFDHATLDGRWKVRDDGIWVWLKVDKGWWSSETKRLIVLWDGEIILEDSNHPRDIKLLGQWWVHDNGVAEGHVKTK